MALLLPPNKHVADTRFWNDAKRPVSRTVAWVVPQLDEVYVCNGIALRVHAIRDQLVHVPAGMLHEGLRGINLANCRLPYEIPIWLPA